MHTKILSVLYFVSGYAASFSMTINEALHLRFIGIFVGVYLTYQLIEQLEQ